LKTGQKSLVHPYLRRAQSLIRGTPNVCLLFFLK